MKVKREPWGVADKFILTDEKGNSEWYMDTVFLARFPEFVGMHPREERDFNVFDAIKCKTNILDLCESQVKVQETISSLRPLDTEFETIEKTIRVSQRCIKLKGEVKNG